MALKFPRNNTDDAELDVTAFLNLMIVLVPVLLLSMTFASVTVLDIKLPELTGGKAASLDSQSKLELVISNKGMRVYFPEDTLIKELPATQTNDDITYDFNTLSAVLQEIKKTVSDKKDIVILLEKDVSYQNIVLAMDSVKSYKTVVVSSVVDIELFPEISLGDAGDI